MTLKKQLWLAISLILLLLFVTSLVVTMTSTQQFYQQQLTHKSQTLAQSLRLVAEHGALTHVADTELHDLLQTIIEREAIAQIELLDAKGEHLVRLQSSQATEPHWLNAWLSLELAPTNVSLSDGSGRQLIVTLDKVAAYQAMMQVLERFVAWYGLAWIVVSLFAAWLLGWLVAPLDRVVLQAEAIQSRRFIRSPVPTTFEFARLVKAMNNLTDGVERMLDQQGKRVEALRYQVQHDAVSGLFSRSYFMAQLDAQLLDDTAQTQHLLLLLRLRSLNQLNHQLGYLETDELLKQVAQNLKSIDWKRESYIARLNGSDFAVLLTDSSLSEQNLTSLAQQVCAVGQELEQPLEFALAALEFSAQQSRSDILQALDGLIADAELAQTQQFYTRSLLEKGLAPYLLKDSTQWRTLFEQAFAKEVVLAKFVSVLDIEGKALLWEARPEILLDGHCYSETSLLPWARRLQLLAQLELKLLESMLQQLRSKQVAHNLNTPVAMQVSAELLQDVQARKEFMRLLNEQRLLCQYIVFEFSEAAWIHDADLLIEFSQKIKQLGAQIAMTEADLNFHRLPQFSELGLSYLIFNPQLTQNLAQDSDKQSLLRAACLLGHSLGIQFIAQGVAQSEQVVLLGQLGVDGVMSQVNGQGHYYELS